MSKIKRIPLGEVIAERVLTASKNSQSGTISVRLGRPVKASGESHFRCPYQIIGLGDNTVRSAAGEDSMQAIQLAFKMIGADLYGYKSFNLKWLDQSDLGFPTP